MAYDSNIANSYLVNGDYDNLTKYLSKFHFTDANKQKQNQYGNKNQGRKCIHFRFDPFFTCV